MAEGNTSEGFTKSRPVLGDLTNILGKRGFSDRQNSGYKSSDLKDNSEDPAKRIHVSSTEINSLKGNVVLGISNIIEENRDDTIGFCLNENNAVIGDPNNKLDVNDNDTLPNMKNNNFKGHDSTDLEGRVPLVSITTKNEISEIAQSKFVGSTESKGKELMDLDREENVVEDVNIDRCHDHNKDFDGDGFKICPKGSQSDDNEYHDWEFGHLVLSQCGSIEGTFLPDSQESKVFGAELNKGNECANNIFEGTESIKACSCLFCTKAGYIWMDLNYQDIKARVSALRKSQKEASIHAERIVRSKGIEKHGVSKLEFDLMYKWRSLFQHMVDAIKHENNQLEARLQPLNDLRDKCRLELEFISAEKRQGEFRGF